MTNSVRGGGSLSGSGIYYGKVQNGKHYLTEVIKMVGTKSKPSLGKLLHGLLSFPGYVFHYGYGKASNLVRSLAQRDRAVALQIRSQTVSAIFKCLSSAKRKSEPGIKTATDSKSALGSGYTISWSRSRSGSGLSREEAELAEQIVHKVHIANRNNVTRTEAYRTMYFNYPELHWALLAHMVSRNGGWNMTDLKGDLLPALVSSKQAGHLFLFLETANAYIFHDAYPQLLLYDESIKRGKNLFHLLPDLHISKFMRPVWDHFWSSRDSVLLTTALIINEQKYIEQRIVQNPTFRKHVFETLPFRAQSFLQLNQVLFPYIPPNSASLNRECVRLAGLVIEHFTDVQERIEAGKKLYALLFGVPQIHQGILAFVRSCAHSGSRADYWPHMFTESKPSNRLTPGHATEGAPSKALVHSSLKGAEGSIPLHSPELSSAWPDQRLQHPERFDWLTDLSVCKYFSTIHPPLSFEMTNEHQFALDKVKLSVLAQRSLF